MIVRQDTILEMETRYRANFINSLGGFKSAIMVGTTDGDGHTNLAIFSSLFHIGANPALCGLIVRPATPGQNTLGNILKTQSFTLNHLNMGNYAAAHQTSAKYAQGESEFEAVGLTPLYEEGIAAPFVKQSHIRIGCELVQKTDIALNGTTLLIGKIIFVDVPEHLIQPDGYIDLETAGTLTCSGLDSYHKTERVERLRYAKV
jgi:flavin reductase (DIM6/NTAB) family NADH-FMN oxidoreductase RutF